MRRRVQERPHPPTDDDRKDARTMTTNAKEGKKMSDAKYYSNHQLAEILGVREQTIRARLCSVDKSYFGLKPIKMPSGHLRWIASEVHAFMENLAARR